MVLNKVSTAPFGAVVGAVLLIAGTHAAAQVAQTLTLSGEIRRGYQRLQRDLVDAAERMPEGRYGFRPTAEVKPFGQLVAHVALSQFRTCAMLKGESNPRKEEKEDAPRSKVDAIALLRASATYCDPSVNVLNDAMMTELTNELK